MNNPWDLSSNAGAAQNSQGGPGASAAYPTFSNPYNIGSQNPFGAQQGPQDQSIPGALASSSYMEKPISQDRPQSSSIGMGPWDQLGQATARDSH